MKKFFDIIYEDDFIVIINKTAGVLAIPDRYDPLKPNVYSVLSKTRESLFTVHRIDKDTSGLMVFAKSAESHKFLSEAFANREIEKYYYCLVDGHPRTEKGSIEKSIGKHRQISGRMQIDNKGKEAISHYELVESFKAHSLLKVKIETGRTHQIRVHMASIDLPLLVDNFYGKRSEFMLSSVMGRKYRISKHQEEKALMKRLSLHACQLSFKHPDSGKKMEFSAPYPKDFKAVINQLRKQA